MNETVISWTPGNWVTILLMVFLGTAIIGAVLKAVHAARSAS